MGGSLGLCYSTYGKIERRFVMNQHKPKYKKPEKSWLDHHRDNLKRLHRNARRGR